MLSCQKATELMEKKDIVGINWLERFQLLMHVKMCAICERYEKQRALIDNLIKNNSKGSISTKDEESLKEKIIHALEK